MIDVAALETNDVSWEILQERADALEGKRRGIAQKVVDFARAFKDSRLSLADYDDFQVTLGWHEDAALDDAFRPGSEAYQAVAALIGDAKTAIARRLWERITDLPYQDASRGTHKRPLLFRSRRFSGLYIYRAVRMLAGYIASLAQGFTASALREMEPWKKYAGLIDVFPNLLGLLLDESPQAGELLAWMEQEFPKRIAQPFDKWCELAGFADLVNGMLASHNAAAHQAVAKLTLDHRLPDFCRQTILEHANTGTREGFANLLKGMLANPVLSSALEHAYCQWLGLNADAIGAENVGNGIHNTLGCLTNPDTRRKFLTTDHDAFWVYQALWATGQDGIEHAIDACRHLAAAGTREQKVAALYYASQFRLAEPQALVAAAVLANPADRSDTGLVGLAVSCLYSARSGPWLRLIELPTVATPAIWPLSRDDARRLYASLKAVVDSIAPGGQTWFGGRVAVGGFFAVAYSLDDLFVIMARLVGREHGMYSSARARAEAGKYPPPAHDVLDTDPDATNLREDICRYFSRMGVVARKTLADEVVRSGDGGPIQKEVWSQLHRDEEKENP